MTAKVHPRWLVVLWVLVLGIAPARAQSSPLSVAVGEASAGWPPIVQIRGVTADRGLRDAMASGLPLRFRVRVELWEKGLFDRLAGAEQSFLALIQDPLDQTYTVDNGRTEQRVATLSQAEDALRAALVFPLHPRGSGRFYYLATLEIETLSLSDLDELRRWLRGEARPAVEGRRSVGQAVERGLRRIFVRTLGLPSRRYEARSPTFVLR